MTYSQEIIVRRILSKPFWKLRVFIKTVLLKLHIRRVSYCKECGIDVRDFSVSDEDWNRVWKYSGGKNVLCWNCYCDYEYLSRKQGECK